MLQDLSEILNSENPKEMEIMIKVLQNLGTSLVREGFRHFMNEHEYKFDKIISKFSIFKKLMATDNTTEDVLE